MAARAPLCSVYFSPHGGCTEAVVEAIQGAQRSIRVQAYSFTSEPIARALVEAHRRGIKVEVILDKSQRTEHFSRAAMLIQAGIPVSLDEVHAIAHNKVMIIDGQIVLTGSFNFTEGAEDRNAENLLEIHDATLAAQYDANWAVHRAHAVAYAAADVPSGDGRQHHRHAPAR